ncbi:hypothetical protein C444_18592 [Haloarcula japonica DSM 6131]|uniref:Uncharacterized protein n=1 Tax=Haloarcula japonica (strain ATCC 49778 / DSM 6131 / JCM 7785 / NBRC 101032 / NCIMB 13157 / TR-1) TaxID=1227453 RepID=M0L1T7_HALJT|nr:hypothetical protein C444_18592 [Haloarcula japonica DSM 6131]
MVTDTVFIGQTERCEARGAVRFRKCFNPVNLPMLVYCRVREICPTEDCIHLLAVFIRKDVTIELEDGDET